MNTLDLQKSDYATIAFWLFPLYRWGVIAPYLVVSTFVFSSLCVIFSVLGMPNFASRVFARAWARTNMVVSLVNIDVIDRHKLNPARSYIIVANHQSLIDIYVLYGYLDVDIKWVMKKELRAVPFLGLACEKMGHIIVDRTNTEAAIKSINDARNRIRDGVSVVFFPEGTRSRTGELMSFKKGAFRLAQELGLPVMPVTIHNTRNVLPSDTTQIVPGRVQLQYNDAIEVNGGGADEVSRLSSESRAVIAATLEQSLTEDAT